MTDGDTETGSWGLSPLLLTAIVFAALVRLTEIYISVTTTLPGVLFTWRSETAGGWGLIEWFCLCTLGFATVAILEVIRKPRALSGWITVTFCLLLTIYTMSIYFYTEAMIDLGYAIDAILK